MPRPHLHGLKNSHLFFDGHTWLLESLSGGGNDSIKAIALHDSPADHLPLGRGSWTINAGSYACETISEDGLELTLSTCLPEQFTCGDGSCIQLK